MTLFVRVKMIFNHLRVIGVVVIVVQMQVHGLTFVGPLPMLTLLRMEIIVKASHPVRNLVWMHIHVV